MSERTVVSSVEFWRLVNERLHSVKWCESVEVSPNLQGGLTYRGQVSGNHPAVDAAPRIVRELLEKVEIQPEHA
jgi:hypothetical protein